MLGTASLMHLPNQDGYKFTGITKDGTHIPCTVKRLPDGLHVVVNHVGGRLTGERKLASWHRNGF